MYTAASVRGLDVFIGPVNGDESREGLEPCDERGKEAPPGQARP